jgi:hypothetical protein
MKDIILFLQNNTSWIKDISTIIFTATGTLIAILSYRRAKSTIFQPKRTEVTKIQTTILSEFLALFTSDGNSIDRAVDYSNIYKYNVDMALRDYNLADIDKISEKYIEYDQNIDGWFQFLENDIYDFIMVEGNITDYDNLIFEKNNKERQKYYEERAKKGEVTIHRIFFTKKYHQFHKKLRNLNNNPFLPKDIQEVAAQISKNIALNLHHDLRNLLTKLVKEIYDAYQDENSNKYELMSKEFKYQTLWRVFEQERKHHEEDYELLKIKIRKHLLIDEKW